MDNFEHPNLHVYQERAHCFYSKFERKGEGKDQTHYCPGCGHGIAHKLIARAVDELGLQDRVVLISPVGCSVFAYYYFDVGNVQVAHGRAPAVATAVKRAHPHGIVLSYQGDGDLAAIGAAEIVHAANRGEAITVFFMNNAIYGMTGGQMAPTTLLGMKSTTSPFGRELHNDGAPMHVSELLSSLDAPVYIERVALGNNKQIQQAAKAIKKALDCQAKGLGFSMVEILSPCPTIWKMNPVDAQHWVNEVMTQHYPLGVYRDKTATAEPYPMPRPKPELSEIPKILEIEDESEGPVDVEDARPDVEFRMKIAGFGGQGVLLLGELLAETGLDAGLEVSWLPSYGPEMRSGTSNCHVRVSAHAVDSPLVTKPNVLLALNEPSLRKFLPTVEPGAWVFYNGRELPADCVRDDVRWVIRPFTEIADGLGDAKAGNIVMLGSVLAMAPSLTLERVDRVLAKRIKSARWLEIDRKALRKGMEVFAGVEEFEHA
jgi:2-oxoisovalerate ferredoxin oxidoreductase beta subunit